MPFGRTVHARLATNSNFTAAQLGGQKLGNVVWVAPPNDAIGWRGYRLIQVIQSGGMSARELVARTNDLTGTVTAAAGETNSTRQLSDTNEFAEDPTHVGDLLIITDDAGAAGAAPEGQFAVISYMDESGDDFVRFETDFALSAAPAASDTYRIKRMWRGDDAADSDDAFNTLGVLPVAVTANYFTYAQCYGICQVVGVNTTAPVVDQAVRTAAVGVTGAADNSTYNAENVGIALDTFSAGGDCVRWSIHIDVLFGLRGEDAVYNRE